MSTNYDNLIPKPSQFDTMNEYLAQLCINTGGLHRVEKWSDVQALVKRGDAEKYFEVGDQVVVKKASSVTATHTGTGITAITVALPTFLNATGTAGNLVFEFEYTDGSWKHNSVPVVLSNYGITITGTPAANDTITVTETATNLVFDVLDFDYDTPSANATGHSMSLGLHDVFTYESIPFDASEGLFYVSATAYPNGLPVGTYTITLDHGSSGGGTSQDGSYMFTTTQVIPVGGMIRHTVMGAYQSSGYTQDQIVAGKFNTYNADYTALESNLATTLDTEGTGTLLGTTSASNPTYKTEDNLNFTERNAYGSNKYAESSDRQFMNSDVAGAASGTASWWSSKNKFDRPVISTLPGFLYGIDPTFKAILGNVKKRTAFSIADGYGYADTDEKIFFQSRYEMYGSSENSIVETSFGTAGATAPVARQYAYWVGTSNADKIKYNNNTARYYWLRSPNSSIAGIVRRVSTDGSLNNSGAYINCGVVPACVIC